MTKVFENLMQAAKIENRLTGQTNTIARGEEQPAPPVDGEVKLMSDPSKSASPKKPVPASAEAPGRAQVAPPAGVSQEDLKRIESLKKAK
ncbi:MAG: hypothetical protein IRY99_04780 [Isosphaeraceae bacterium]|nr:hypothetical protein [Isosphaeraceae bacterium]